MYIPPSCPDESTDTPLKQEFHEEPSIPFSQSDPLQPASDPDQDNPPSIDEEKDAEAAENEKLNPGTTHFYSPISVEVSVGTSGSDSMLTSPTFNSRRAQKRKKGKGALNFKRRQAIEKKVRALLERLNLVPFVPSKALDFAKHEGLLQRLGLWDFVNLGLGSDSVLIRTDLVAQLIATYDHNARGSIVNEFKIKVSRADLGRALKLASKKEKVGTDGVELDPTPLSEESVAFLEDFVSNWFVLHEDEELWMMPDEVVNMTKPIKEGHPEKVDWLTLMWFMVEKELMQGEQLINCNYATHLQFLIKSQREELLVMEPEEAACVEEPETLSLQEMEVEEFTLEEVPKIAKTSEEILMKKDNGDEEEVTEKKDYGKVEELTEKKDDGVKQEVLEKKDHGKEEELLEKKDDGKEEEVLVEKDDVKEEEDVLVKKNDVKEEDLLEKKDHTKEEEVVEKKDDGAEEEVLEKKDHGKEAEVLEEKGDVKEEEKKDNIKQEELLGENNDGNEGASKADKVREGGEEQSYILGGPSVELTLGKETMIAEGPRDSEMMDFEDFNSDDVEQDQRQWLLDGKNKVGEHLLRPCSMRNNSGFDDLEEKEDDIEDLGEVGEEDEDGFDVVPTDDNLEAEGLTGNSLRTPETAQLAYGSRSQLNAHPSVDLLESHNDLHDMNASGPSFYGNNGKRKIDDDIDNSQHALGSGSKRSRMEDSWGHNQMDFGTCMEEIQILTDRARTMYMEKVRNQEQLNMNQQILLNEVQKRDAVIDRLHQVKQQEIEKRDAEILRLNRELFLMCNLLEDYRKALKQTDKVFSEYRQRFQLHEEPVYKDCGPGGLVLSVRDIEKRREKEEEEFRVNCSIVQQKAKETEESYAMGFAEFVDKVDRLDKRLSVIENEFKSLKDSRPERKDSVTCDSPAND